MISKLHVISGLPRSGSTLLSALLRQNPRFHAAMSSPVAPLCGALHHKMCGGEFSVFFDDERRRTMLHGVFDAYYAKYAKASESDVVFDTSRAWTGRAALLGTLFPDARIICCVRDVGWISDSVERMLNKNPLQLSRIFGFQPGSSVYARVETLMNSEKGLIGVAWSTLREAWFGDEAKRLVVVPYEHLVHQPERTLERLYSAIGEPVWNHDLNNVVYAEPDYDSHIGMPGLHTVRQKVAHQDRPPCIPHDIFSKYESANFWAKAELNPRRVSSI